MSVYETDHKSIYPHIAASAPSIDVDHDESNAYKLKKITEIENFLANEIIERDRLYKKFKRGAQALVYIDHTLLAGTIICTSGGLAGVLTGIGTPAAIAFGSIGLLAVITQGVLNKTAQIYTKKSMKHHDIQLAAQTILDGISILISKSVEDGHISQNEYQKILQEKQRYLTLKSQIRKKTKKLVNTITQRTARRNSPTGPPRGKTGFFKANRKFFRYPTCQCHIKYEQPPPYF